MRCHPGGSCNGRSATTGSIVRVVVRVVVAVADGAAVMTGGDD